METKLCTKCREVLPLEAFSTKRNSETKLAARCDRCRSASAVQWNARNPERMRLAGARFIAPGQARASRLRRTHGINPGDYQRLLVAQQHRCAICRRDSKQGRWSCLHVDHDHETAVIRGLLCTNCNRGLGYFNDSRERLAAAITYLSRRATQDGDPALVGGVATRQMQERLVVPEARPLIDSLPTLKIKAKDFTNEITIHNTKERDLRTEPAITREHVQNSREIRRTLGKRGIEPEKLETGEDVKKVARRLAGEQDRLPRSSRRLRREADGKKPS